MPRVDAAGVGRFCLRGVPYFLVAAAAAAVLIAGLRLSWGDLHKPFMYRDDAVLIQHTLKNLIETGNIFRNDRLGYPGGAESYDFPLTDYAHFAAVWALGRVTGGWVVAFNLYHLLTYPLTAVSGMFALRRLGLSAPAAAAAGLLYAFLPYHYIRGEGHYCLAAYYVVPLTAWVVLRVAGGDLPFFTRRADGRWTSGLWSRRTWAAVGVAALTATAGLYYAAFGAALAVAAGLYGWAARRCWRTGAAGGLVAGVIAAGVAAGLVPTFAYQTVYGRNTAATARPPAESEVYGLKVVQLLLPVADHHNQALGRARRGYDTPDRPVLNENEAATLGLVGSAGFLGLLAVVLLPRRPGWPLGPVAALTLVAVLIGTVGGGGAVFAQFVTPQLRGVNRISVYIAFFSLFAACRWVDRAVDGGRWAGRVRVPVFAGVAAVGLWDLTPARWFTPAEAEARAAVAARYQADADFFAAAERAVPGGAVLCLPYKGWPECDGYEHARGYLHTRTLRFSFGAMRERETDLWLRSLSADPVDRALRRAAVRGFDAVLVDHRLLGKRAPGPTAAEVRAALGPDCPPPVAHPDGQQFFFDLRPYRDRLRAELGSGFGAEARREAERVSFLWLHGFGAWDPYGTEYPARWCGRTGELVIVNPTDRTRTVRVGATLSTRRASWAALRVAGGAVWSEDLALAAHDLRVERTLVIPPGRHRVTFHCRPADDFTTALPLGEVWLVMSFAAAEVAGD